MFNRFHPSLIFVLLLAGCSEQPASRSYDDVDVQGVVLATSDTKQYRWPVAGDTWQITKPTDFAFLRRATAGKYNLIAEEIQRKNKQRLLESAKSDTPAPWEAAALGWSREETENLRLALSEYDGHPLKRFDVNIPNEIQNPRPRLDLTARHLVIGGDNGVWMARLPWRPWWGLPGTPPTDEDEPGDPTDFAKLKLGTDSKAPAYVGFFGAEKDGSDSRCLVAKGKQVHLVDCGKRSVLKSQDIDQTIIHLHVAPETGHAILVDETGNLYLSDPKLNQVSKIAKVDTSLPMPQISPEAARVAMYKDERTAKVIKLTRGAVIEALELALKGDEKPQFVRCSRAYDMWGGKTMLQKRANYPGKESGGRSVFSCTLYWELEQVHDVFNFPTACSQLCVALRTDKDGKKQRVLFDARLGYRDFWRAVAFDQFEGKELTIAGNGNTIALYDQKTIGIYARGRIAPLGTSYLHDLADTIVWESEFERAEQLWKLIRSLPEERFNRRPEQFESMVVSGIVGAWLNTEDWIQEKYKKSNPEAYAIAKKGLPEFTKWAATDTPLALTVKMYYHSRKAWQARGGGWSSSVGQSQWQVFEDENEKAVNAWKALSKLDEIPATAFAIFIELARDTGLDYSDVQDEVGRYMEAYPHDDELHREVMPWRLEKWGGNRGSGAAYAGGVANAVGGGKGDFIYVRCIESIQANFPYAFFNYAMVDASRVLSGIRYGLATNYYQQESAVTALYLIDQSHSRDGAPSSRSAYAKHAVGICDDLAAYYKWHYPMLVSRFAGNSRLEGSVFKFLPK